MLNERKSLLDVLIDILVYYQNGNWGTFVRSFDLALSYFNFEVTKNKKRKLRNYARSYLRHTGFITASYNPEFKWSCTDPAIIQISDESYAAIGDFRFRCFFFKEFKDSIRIVNLREPSLDLLKMEHTFYPSISVASVRESNVVAYANKHNIQFTKNYSNSLFKFLPSIDDAQKKCLVKYGSKHFLNPDDSEKFNSNTMKWEKYTNPIPDTSGLYRNNYKYSLSKYYLVFNKKNFLQAFEVIEIDWAYILHSTLVEKWIGIDYSENDKTLSIRVGNGKLPEIIEKTIRSVSLEIPEEARDGKRVYRGVSKIQFKTLSSKMKV